MAAIDDDTGLLWITSPNDKRRGSANDKNVPGRIAAFPYDSSTYIQPELVEPPPGYIALDFETEDPTLLERGSAWAFAGIGQIIGMAVAWEGFEAYYPIAHREGNVDAARVIEWLTAQFKREDVTFVAANAAYDLGWARRVCGMYPRGGIEDVQFMAALLDEYRLSYSLDSISKDYLKLGKDFDFLGAIEKKLSLKHAQVMANLKQLPGAAVASYAATDARRTYDLYTVLKPLIVDEGLLTVHALESALIPMSVEMKRRGIRVNVDESARLSEDIKSNRMPALQNEIKRLTGVDVEPWEAETLERALKECGVECERTRTGQPKVDQVTLAEWAKTIPVAAHILALRKMSKIQNTFLDGHILGHQHLGRVHCDFNQLRSEREGGSGFGTVSGRYSCTSPNLQQIPTRDKEWGPLMRSLFLAEEGQKIASLDYSSQEPRLAVHFAAKAGLPGAAEAVEKFKRDPRTDYHKMVAEIANIPRSQAKTINLGCFGPDTLILTNNGIKPITYVTTDDMLWDGMEWVTHRGLLNQGEKDTIRVLGDLRVTTDHLILCGNQWVSAIALALDGNIRSQALETGSENLPSPDLLSDPVAESRKYWFSVLADPRNTGLSLITYLKEKLRSACHAVRKSWQENVVNIILTLGLCPRTNIEQDFLIDCPRQSLDATTKRVGFIITTAAEEFSSMKNGEMTGENFYFTRRRSPVGIFQNSRWIEWIITRVTNRATLGSSPAKLTRITRELFEVSKQKLQTYDIACAGPRNRFTVVTSAGYIIAHNCAYGMGGAKLARSLGLPTQWMKVVKSGTRTRWEEISENQVESLRSQHYDCIEVAGDEAKGIIKRWEEGAPFLRGLYKLCDQVGAQRGFIKTILNRRCRFQIGKDGKYGFTHKAMNRLCQGSAADQTKQGMLDLWNQGHVPLLTVHDELVFSVENEEEARRYSPVMENAIQLEVPSVVDVNLGTTWGDVEK